MIKTRANVQIGNTFTKDTNRNPQIMVESFRVQGKKATVTSAVPTPKPAGSTSAANKETRKPPIPQI